MHLSKEYYESGVNISAPQNDIGRSGLIPAGSDLQLLFF